MSTEVKII